MKSEVRYQNAELRDTLASAICLHPFSFVVPPSPFISVETSHGGSWRTKEILDKGGRGSIISKFGERVVEKMSHGGKT
jgi:hypothetical protein